MHAHIMTAQDLSASIDGDDYFELMMRNAWHISGGQGWAANSANKRVLVRTKDGREAVQEVQRDLGLRGNDVAGMRQRLMAQQGSGLDGTEAIESCGGYDSTSKAKRPNAMADKFAASAAQAKAKGPTAPWAVDQQCKVENAGGGEGQKRRLSRPKLRSTYGF